MPDGLTRLKVWGDAAFLGAQTAGASLGTNADVFWDASASQWNFNNGVSLVLGGTSQQTVSDGDGTTNLIPELQVLGTAKADSSILLGSFNTTDNATVAPSLNFLKSGNATIGSNTIVANNEVLGEITFFGADGTDFESPAARIQAVADATIGVGDMPGRLVFATTADAGETLTEAMRISSAQDVRLAAGLIVGDTSAQVTISDGDGATNLIPEVQVLGTAKADASVLIASFNATDDATVAPSLNLLKSGNATLGSNTIVANNEILGQIQFFGADGTDFESPGARIHAAVDGTPGVGDMPTELVFSTTPDGSETLAARLTISAEGLLTAAASTTPASVGTTPGTAAGAILTMTGGVGGATSIATTGTGGEGGGVSITLGAGGAANSATTAATGGAGGAWAVTMGAGAAVAVAGTTATGGAGGAWTTATGAGGAVSLAVSGTATGGASGAISLLSGTGGAVTATTGTNVGGASGTVTIGSGVGGAASGATDTGGASGAVVIRTGTGGSGDTGGASGSLTIQTGAVGAGGSPTAGSILFSPAAVESMRLTLLQAFIGDTADANVTQGLTINQGASDNLILALKSSDVAHATTTLVETDTYGSFAKSEATTGGLRIGGYKDGDGTVLGQALLLVGVLDETAADTTKSTAAVGIVQIDAGIEGTNTIADAGANENLVAVRNNATTRFILDADGDSHQDVGTAWTNFDDYDDTKLLTALSVGVAREGDPVRESFSNVLEEYRPHLEKARLVQFNKDGHHFVNMSRLTMVLTGAVRQLSAKLGEAMHRLAVAEQRLLALPGK